MKCSQSCHYFLNTYAHIYDATLGTWIPFTLWPDQVRALDSLINKRLVVILKARQLGMTWLCLGYALWRMLFRPSATCLLFSRREEEAAMLVSRLRGMYKHVVGLEIDKEVRLPGAEKIITDNTLKWELSNGSIAHGFPTTAGDSYTATLAIVDEADLIPDLDRLMNAVKPTIDGGGQMVLLSRSNKDEPNSAFKRMFVSASRGLSPWTSVFIPWFARPTRTQEWYDEQKADVLSRTGSLDDLFQQYPATPEEALMARTLDKRFPSSWLTAAYDETPAIPLEDLDGVPGINGLEIFMAPRENGRYALGADPAEGNPTSDPSSMSVIDVDTGDEVAALTDQIEPSVFGDYIGQVATFYNNAATMIERNNHGHAVIQWLRETSRWYVRLLAGRDGKEGWLQNVRDKADMWTRVADGVRPQTRWLTIRSQETFLQLSGIEGATLQAPKGQHDDRAVSYALAVAAAEAQAFSDLGGIHV